MDCETYILTNINTTMLDYMARHTALRIFLSENTLFGLAATTTNKKIRISE